MDVSTRAALIQRIAPYLPAGAPVPQSWAELPITTQLLVEQNDPEAMAVMQGVMVPELEAQVLAGKWKAEAPAPRDLAAERAAAVQAWVDAHPISTPEEQAAQIRQQQQLNEASRQASAAVANQKQALIGRASGAWGF